MKFIKIHFNKAEGHPDEWRLLIDNSTDLFKYANIEVSLYGEAFASSDKNYLNIDQKAEAAIGGRSSAIARLVDTKIKGTPEGEKVYPLQVVAEWLDKKSMAMLKYIELYGPICVNHAGGWCGLNTALNSWNACIVESIEKEGCGMPSDDEPLNVQTLVLENASYQLVDSFGRNEAAAVFPGTSIGYICNLREADERYVYKSILNANNVFISTMAEDERQVDMFVKMFIAIPGAKEVHIRTNEAGKLNIESHVLFSQIKHNVTFQLF